MSLERTEEIVVMSERKRYNSLGAGEVHIYNLEIAVLDSCHEPISAPISTSKDPYNQTNYIIRVRF